MSDRTRTLRVPTRLVAALALAAAAGCGPGPYERYQAAHPGWEPSLPHAPAGLEELVAALDAPDRVPEARVKLKDVTVLEVGGPTWRRVDVGTLGSVEPDADHAVIAVRDCQALKGGQRLDVVRVDSYLLRAGRLAAYDHSDFRADCQVDAKFLAARGDDVELETALASYVRKEYGPRPLRVVDLYRRGLAYLEAGRLTEARAVLQLGERAYEAAERAADDPNAPPLKLREREERAERKRLRERLHQALGVDLPD